MNRILPFLLMMMAGQAAFGQDTLPRFTVRHLGSNRVVVEWLNNYPVTKQISIQRSHDSLKNFKTIMTVTDPTAVQNGFADTKAPHDHMYYRLFVNLDKGEFFFTGSMKPRQDTATTPAVNRSVIRPKTKDSLAITIRQPGIKKPDFTPSFYVYTNKEGYVFINLPDAERKKYHIKFFDGDNSLLFEIRNIREPALTLDKVNFLRAGWFSFELYNEEMLVEKNKVYLPKEF